MIAASTAPTAQLLPLLPAPAAAPAVRALLTRQLRVDARGLQELTIAIGEGTVRVHAVPEAVALEIRAIVRGDPETAPAGLRDRLKIIVDRPSAALAHLLITLDPSADPSDDPSADPSVDRDGALAPHLDVLVTVPAAITLALDHAPGE